MFSAKTIPSLLLALVSIPAASAVAAIVGTNVPSQSLTTERVASLPAANRMSWETYLASSAKQSRADRAAFAAELRNLKTNAPSSPPPGRGTRGLALNKAASWYSSSEALRLAGIIVSFQTPAGGWSKNLDLTQHQRAPGEMFATGNLSRFATSTDLDLPHDPDWNYVGTFDNGATITQLRFLAKIISTGEKKHGDVFHTSFLRGLDYIFAAQFPNGGWPQVWPLQGGYHDGITFNDGAMTGILDLLSDVAEAKAEFKFVPDMIRERAATSLQQGLACVLATQIIVAGQRTAWGQQYDALTLQPSSARNYEMPSLSSGESAGVMLCLMRLPKPDAEVIAAVHAAAAWFERAAIHDQSYQRIGDDGPQLVATPGSGPIWSRYYEIKTNRPIFGDRDKSIHDTVAEISKERRVGYSWFTDAPKSALKTYARWKQKW
jgi:PelA/Pel-15E family pectate lyase